MPLNLNIVKILGPDKEILKQSSEKEQKKYLFVSRLVVLNLLLSFAGMTYLFYLLFDSFVIALFVEILSLER